MKELQVKVESRKGEKVERESFRGVPSILYKDQLDFQK